MLNLNQLRAFYQAAKCQNVSVAAKHLFVSQPSVTAQIKLFEDNCGLKLFKKKGRNLYLTDEGKTLYNYARKLFEYEKIIEDAVEQMKELKKGNLRLGSARTYARYFMPFLLTGNVLMETGDAEIIKLLVQHGEGISFLVKEAVAVELQEKKLATAPLKNHSIFLDVNIAYLKNQPLSPPAQAFLKSLEGVGTKKMRFQGMGALMAKMLARER